jgi:hypothetical protein
MHQIALNLRYEQARRPSSDPTIPRPTFSIPLRALIVVNLALNVAEWLVSTLQHMRGIHVDLVFALTVVAISGMTAAAMGELGTWWNYMDV